MELVRLPLESHFHLSSAITHMRNDQCSCTEGASTHKSGIVFHPRILAASPGLCSHLKFKDQLGVNCLVLVTYQEHVARD